MEKVVAEHPDLVRYKCVLVAGYADLGMTDAIEAHLRPLADGDFVELPDDLSWACSAVLAAEASVALNDRRACNALYEQLLPWSDVNVVLGSGGAYFGSTSYFLGRLAFVMGRTDAAVEHLEHAVRMNSRVRARTWARRSKRELARVLRVRGDRGDRLQALELLDGEEA
jgi:hypothetical protein